MLPFTTTEENLNYSAQGLVSTFSKYFPTLEIANQYAHQPERIANTVYAKRLGNGSEASGDGWTYRGQGLKQLTGKSNHEAFFNALSGLGVGGTDREHVRFASLLAH